MDIGLISPSALAFVGDAVFTLFVRAELAKKYDYKSGVLTKKAARIVSAVNQSRLIEFLEPLLSEEERDIFKRCRNAHSGTMAKNATAAEYHRATGLEGLLGWLHLSGSSERLELILMKCLEYSE